MELKDVLEALGHIWPILLAIAAIIFDWGVLWSKMKTFISKDKLADAIANTKLFVSKEELTAHVDKLLVGHCPFEQPMKKLEVEILALKKWKEEHETWGLKMNEQNHLLLQEIVINLKMVCTHLKLKYEPGNGNKYGN
jgi:hypothetical protein